jgi:RhtB (resistance to homoserine/threonine) family protein
MEFLLQFLSIAALVYFTAMIPGPDVAVVMKNSLLRSRTDGIATAFGIAFGNCIYVSLVLAGLGVVIMQSVVAFSVIKYLGAAYIVYLGVKLLYAKPHDDLSVSAGGPLARSSFEAFREGLLTNLGNPKFMLFLLSVFTWVIGPDTPLLERIVYGAEIPFFAFLSFSTVALIAGAPVVRKTLSKATHIIERVMGVALIVLGILIIL